MASVHEGCPRALYPAVAGVGSGVGCSHCSAQRENTDLENSSPSRSPRVGPHCSGHIMSRDCGPGIIADSCTHTEPDQEKSGPRSSGDVTSSPGVHHVMSPSPGGPGDQIAETRTGNCLAPLSSLHCLESKWLCVQTFKPFQ